MSTNNLHTCWVCEKDPASGCSRCKRVHYCSRECQLEDWRIHKKTCKLKNQHACQLCKKDDQVNFNQVEFCCLQCGYLFCGYCYTQKMLYVIPHRNGRDNIRKFRPYPGCGGKQSLNIQKKSNAKRLQRLIDTKLDDVRRPAWILVLGRYEKIIVGANNDKVRSRCLEAADAGAGGEAFYAVAQLYEEDEDWENQKKYLHIAADLSDHRALYRLACLSLFGQSNTKQDDAKHSNG